MKKTSTILIIVLILLVIAGGLYWYFLMGPATVTPGNGDQSGFNPFGGIGSANNPGGADQNGVGGDNGSNQNPGGSTNTGGTQNPAALPALRLLSNTPVGGYGAMSTTTDTIVRWADRGRGNVYEANYKTADITTLSNTVVPRIYGSAWNKNLTAFIGSLFQEGDSAASAVYAELTPQSASAIAGTDGSTIAPYSLHGKNLPGNMIGYAVSPDRSKLFMLVNESGSGVGYVSSFTGQSTVKIFTTPLTQVNVDWPSDNIIAITTKGSASYSGFLYFVNPKTGTWTKELGPLPGMSAKVSRDGKSAIVSATASGGLNTSIYTLATAVGTDAVIRTLADKCAWGNFYKDTVYCAVPTQLPSGTYPDDWYSGKLSTTDKIWQVNAVTGEVHLVSSLVDQADRIIDGFTLGLDPRDDYLFFMNKNDLSLWSLDLVQSH